MPRVSAASRMDFLSGLVMVEGAMVALIDLSNMLSDAADMADEGSATH